MNRLKELRESKRYSQRELAKKVGVSQGTLSNWERGEHDIDTDTLLILAEMFNCTTDYILGRTHNPQVEYIPADPAKVAEHVAEQDRRSRENWQNVNNEIDKLVDKRARELITSQQKKPSASTGGEDAELEELFNQIRNASSKKQDRIKKVIELYMED